MSSAKRPTLHTIPRTPPPSSPSSGTRTPPTPIYPNPSPSSSSPSSSSPSSSSQGTSAAHTAAAATTTLPNHVYGVLFRRRPYSYAGVPLEQFVSRPTVDIRKLRDPLETRPTRILNHNLNTDYSVFYVLTFNIDRRQVVKIGVAENAIRRMHDYLYTYGHVCPGAKQAAPSPLTLRNRTVPRTQPPVPRTGIHECDPPNPATGVYLHMMLLCKKRKYSDTTYMYYRKSGQPVRRLEHQLKQHYRALRPRPSRGSERFVVKVKPFVQNILQGALHIQEQTPVAVRQSQRRGSSTKHTMRRSATTHQSHTHTRTCTRTRTRSSRHNRTPRPHSHAQPQTPPSQPHRQPPQRVIQRSQTVHPLIRGTQ